MPSVTNIHIPLKICCNRVSESLRHRNRLGRKVELAPYRYRVALLVETSLAYGREIHEGIAEYVRAHAPWSIYVEQRDLAAEPPPWLTRRIWDGIIVRPTTTRLVRTFNRLKIPAVDLNDRLTGFGIPRIRSDDEAIGRMAAEHLLERGFKSFGFCGFKGEAWAQRRRKGFLDAITERGFPCGVYESYWKGPKALRWDTDQDRISAWLQTLPRPLGVGTCSDARGQHLLESCRRLDLAVPENVAVIGVDNEEQLCRLCDPPLSTVLPNARRIGFAAAELLQKMMSTGKTPARAEWVIPPVGVVARQSTDVLAIDDPKVAAAVRYIRENACQGICVDDVLRQVPISRSLLELRFREQLGRTPHAEIRHVQLERARQLLIESEIPLKQVAQLAGFVHVEYFNYFFKQSIGQTPGAFRRAHSRRPT